METVDSLFQAAIIGDTSAWARDRRVANAVSALVGDPRIAQLARQDAPTADFLLASTCAWISAELCSTLPDPGRVLLAVAPPSENEREALVGHLSTLLDHADPAVSSLAGAVLASLVSGDARRSASEVVARNRASLHSSCRPFSLDGLPARPDDVAEWIARELQSGACRCAPNTSAYHEALAAAAPETARAARALSAVFTRFGYRDAWRADPLPLHTLLEATLVAAETEALKYGVTSTLRARSEISRRKLAPLGSRAVDWQESFSRAALAGLVFRTTDVVMNADLLAGLSRANGEPSGSTASNALSRIADAALAVDRQAQLVGRERSPRARRTFVRLLLGFLPLVALIVGGLTALTFSILPLWAAAWLMGPVSGAAIALARKISHYRGLVAWTPAWTIGATYGLMALVPDAIGLLREGLPPAWELALSAGGAVATLIISILMIRKPLRSRFSVGAVLAGEFVPSDVSSIAQAATLVIADRQSRPKKRT